MCSDFLSKLSRFFFLLKQHTIATSVVAERVHTMLSFFNLSTILKIAKNAILTSFNVDYNKNRSGQNIQVLQVVFHDVRQTFKKGGCNFGCCC